MKLGDSNKYPQNMFPWFIKYHIFSIPNYLPHHELKIHSIQIVFITRFVIISDVGIERVGCNMIEHRFEDVCNDKNHLSTHAAFFFLSLFVGAVKPRQVVHTRLTGASSVSSLNSQNRYC